MKSLDDALEYRKFITDRDQALEHFHVLAQKRQSDIMRAILSVTANIIRQSYPSLIDHKHPHAIDSVAKQLDGFYGFAAAEFARVLYRLRSASYTLSYTGQIEALGRVLPDQLTKHLPKDQIQNHRNKKSTLGGPVEARIKMYLDRMKRKILSATQLAALATDDEGKPLSLSDFMSRVLQSMPQSRIVKQPRKALRKLTEAKKEPGVDASIITVDDEEWNRMIDDYMLDYIPKWRGPESTVSDLATPTRVRAGQAIDADEWYSWELEKDLTHELVHSVRNGEFDAGQTAGITDFIWVAVIDNKTCDDCCDGSGCYDRDGLTTREIEEKFGEPINPPAHFNCRCRLVPALESIPDKPEVDYQSFDEWLQT